MTVADGSQVRLADVTETTIGTTPTTPAFQVMRYVTADVKLNKQTDIPNEVRPDRNVGSIVDVGRSVTGSINTLLSYGTFDTWLARLMCSAWTGDVLKNGVTPSSGSLELTFEQGTTDSYVRYRGVRCNTLDLTLRSRQSVEANWGIIGLGDTTPGTTIITGATYTAPTTTPVFNAGLNVSALTFTGIASAPKIQAMTMRINNNIYQNDVVGAYEPYSLGLGRFDVTGSITAYFENLDTFNAIRNHTDVALGFTLLDGPGNQYIVSIPKVKLLDGGPTGVGNGQPVMLEVPYQAYFDATSSASLTITRDPV